MNPISYDIQYRPQKRYWAVIRNGSRGGRKVIAVYVDQLAAQWVYSALAAQAGHEAG